MSEQPSVPADPPPVAEDQDAARRVVAVAARAGPPEAVFRAVTDEASALLGGALTTLARYERSGNEQLILAHTGDHLVDGEWFPGDNANTISARMWRSWRPERVDDFGAVPGPRPRFDRRGVRACVGVPVFVDGDLWGCLSAASRTGPLPVGTEDRLTGFTEIVAAAVASAAARTSMQMLADEQAALLRVAALVAQGRPESAVFDAVTREAASLIDEEPTTLVRYEGHRAFTVLATRGGPLGPPTRFVVPTDDAGTLDAMMRTGRPARQDRYETIADRSFSNREFAVGSSVSVPIVAHGRLWGALGVLNKGRRLPAETESRLTKFCELVVSTLASAEARAELERFGLEQAALRRVAELAAGDVPEADVLRAVVVEAAALFDEAVVAVGDVDPAGGWRRIDGAGGLPADGPVPAPPPAEEEVARRVLRSGRAHRVEDVEPSPAGRHVGVRLLWGCGVPVRVDGETWGALVVTAGWRPLPSGTEDRLTQFAHVAATAVSGARSRDALGRLARDQAALRRVAELIARGAPLDEVLGAVATEASGIAGERPAGLFRGDADGLATVVASSRGFEKVGGRVLQDLAGLPASREAGGLLVVPIVVEGQAWGGLATSTGTAGPPSAGTKARLTEFAELAAAAVANARNKAELRASRARLVVTADETRRRLQRDVHDGAQQRLVQTVLTLRLGLDLAARGEDPVELMREALDNAERATVELRDLAHGILPASLSRGGLRSGLESLIAGLSVAVDLDASGFPEHRLPSDLEVTAYFVVAEALTNIVKHADATRAGVRVALDEDTGVLTIEVDDDGRGGADPRGTGLTGIADRVDASNGRLVLSSPPGVGTSVQVTLPLTGRG